MVNRILAASIAIAALALPASAIAQDEDDPYAACVAMDADAARLACFDTTHSEQRVVIAERAEREEEEREEIFGFSELDDALEREAQLQVSASVAEILQGARRSQVLLLDNGQLWREIDGSTMRNRVREGWGVTIERHWSGAYEMRFEGRSGYLRVSRMQ